MDRNLKRVAREQRITRAPGDAGGVSLALAGDVVWVAWSDPRESPREGLADIYVTTLHAADATPAGEEVRVLATARHSRSPRIVATPDGGAIVAWIEDAPTGLEGPTDAMVARLDASERVVAAPSVIRCNEGGRPVTVALAREGDGVRAITACAGQERVTLQSSSIAVDGSPAAASTSLLDLDAPPSFDVALAYAGHAVVFDDVGTTRTDHRVRRAVIEWKR